MNVAGHNSVHGSATAAPRIRTISADRPWVWLAAGWQDLCRAPGVSLTYGALLVVASFVLVAGLAALDLYFLILPFAAGFMLVGPLVAVGLYEVSRRFEAGETPGLGTALGAYARNATQIGAIGLFLMLLLLFWIRVALLLFALFFSSHLPPLDQLLDATFFSLQAVPFLFTGTVIGAVFAGVAFAVSALSIPMLLDRPDTNIFDAVTASVGAVIHNWRAMVVWAALIVLFTAAGMVSLFLGLAVALPLIAHASWHAYKDILGGD